MGLQKLQTALLAEEHDEIPICAASAGFGVAIAAEEAVGDVQHPLLGFPPRPRRPSVWV